MLVTKDIDNKVFNCIDPYSETLAYKVLEIRASYHHTIMNTPGQAVFGIDILFNLASVIYWRVANSVKDIQVDIGNVRENSKKITHNYVIC